MTSFSPCFSFLTEVGSQCYCTHYPGRSPAIRLECVFLASGETGLNSKRKLSVRLERMSQDIYPVEFLAFRVLAHEFVRLFVLPWVPYDYCSLSRRPLRRTENIQYVSMHGDVVKPRKSLVVFLWEKLQPRIT